MARRKTQPPFDFSVIPSGSFVIFRTPNPLQLASTLAEGSYAAEALEERGITGMILTPDEEISCLTDADLAHMGLKRLREYKPKDRH